jgi:GNAT superfamily N-acetyltransferase
MLRVAARNCGEAFAVPAARMGRPVLRTDTVIGSDLGSPITSPVNGAVLLRPLGPEDLPGLLADLGRLFSGPGGGWVLWDPWAAVDLTPQGFRGAPVPCLLRPAGGDAPGRPPGLDVVEVADERGLDDMTAVIVEGFGFPDAAVDHSWTLPAFGRPDFRAWVGYVHGRAVSTATAYRDDDVVGVYAVATRPAARGQGYGEALSWVATLSAPELPAVLQASPMGRPVYERMGYRVIGTFTEWRTRRRPA